MSTENLENQKDGPDQGKEKSFFGIIVHSFFIIPFLIAVFCVLLFASISLLTSEKRTVFEYLEDVKTGGLNKRWQAAFELSKILANPKHVPDSERFTNEMIHAFRESFHDDPRVRQYLALAMGRSGNVEYFPVLVEKLDEERIETLTAIIYALGMLKDPKAIPEILPYLKHENARVRSITTVAIGNIGVQDPIPELKAALNDPEPNVKWGAAVSLALLGDDAGIDIVKSMLNRDYYQQFPEIDTEEETQLILTAIDAATHITDEKTEELLKDLAGTDKNMKVRAAAMKAAGLE